MSELGDTPDRAQFEYLVRDDPQRDDLTLLGARGWELVAVLPATNLRRSRFFFKRAAVSPLPETEQ